MTYRMRQDSTEGADYLLVIFRCINVFKGERPNRRLGLCKQGGAEGWRREKGMADLVFFSSLALDSAQKKSEGTSVR